MKKNVAKDSKTSFEKFVGKAVLDKKMLSVVGGDWPGQGYFSTISGDCNKSHRSCWDLLPAQAPELADPEISIQP